jgi:hypothetical protein
MRTGGCLCGSVRFELTAEPGMFGFCHCRDCQHLSGGEPVAVVVGPRESFRVTQGELKAYRNIAASGNVTDRHFCADCGAHIASRLEAGPFMAVRVSTLDEPTGLQPQFEIWTSSAQPWAHRPAGVASFEENAPG